MLYRIHLAMNEFTTLVVIGTDSIGNCKSNYHMITTMTAPLRFNPLPAAIQVLKGDIYIYMLFRNMSTQNLLIIGHRLN
jgi:hypothetical protein